MSEDAIAGRGLVLRVGNGQTPETFTPVAELRGGRNILPERLVFANATDMSTPAFQSKKKPISVEVGEMVFPVFWLPADGTHDHKTGFRYDQENMILRNYQLALPGDDALRIAFSGWVVSMSPDIPLDDLMTCDVTIQPSGAIALEDDD